MRIVVVGGGIAGLSAALRIADQRPDADLTIVEAAARLGGKLRTGAIAGVYVETAAESLLIRDPDGSDSPAARLVHRLGLAGDLRFPAPLGAAIAAGGALRPIPAGTLMGVPGSSADLDGLARVDPAADAPAGAPLLGPDEDVAVGDLVRRRLGGDVADRLVDPLLGGVYAGHADGLSLAATVPALASACRTADTLRGAVDLALAGTRSRAGGTDRDARSGAAAGAAGRALATLAGGLSSLVDAAMVRLIARGRVQIRLGLPVRELGRTATGWRLTVGSTHDPEYLEADGVVLALPARPAARLLAGVDAAAAGEIATIDYASVGLVTLALPPTELPALSGFLVPATEGFAVKAVTLFTAKWPHLRPADGTVVLRASLGRHGEEQVLQRDNAELIDLVAGEISHLVDRKLPIPVASAVHRWGGALPQYTPGHLDRVAGARTSLAATAPTIGLAGAGYDGVGIRAAVGSGETAADLVVAAVVGTAATRTPAIPGTPATARTPATSPGTPATPGAPGESEK